MNTREIARFVRKFRLQDGDVMLIKEGTALAKKEVLEGFAEFFATHVKGKGNILFVVIDDFDNVAILDKATMQKKGWYRLEDLQSLINKTKAVKVQLVPKIAVAEDVKETMNGQNE